MGNIFKPNWLDEELQLNSIMGCFFEGQSTNALWPLILNPRVRDDTNPQKYRTVFFKCSIFFLVEITVSVTSIFSLESQDNLIFKEKRNKTNNHTQKTQPNKKTQPTDQRMGQLHVKIGQWQFAFWGLGKVIFRRLDTWVVWVGSSQASGNCWNATEFQKLTSYPDGKLR